MYSLYWPAAERSERQQSTTLYTLTVSVQPTQSYTQVFGICTLSGLGELYSLLLCVQCICADAFEYRSCREERFEIRLDYHHHRPNSEHAHTCTKLYWFLLSSIYLSLSFSSSFAAGWSRPSLLPSFTHSHSSALSFSHRVCLIFSKADVERRTSGIDDEQCALPVCMLRLVQICWRQRRLGAGTVRVHHSRGGRVCMYIVVGSRLYYSVRSTTRTNSGSLATTSTRAVYRWMTDWLAAWRALRDVAGQRLHYCGHTELVRVWVSERVSTNVRSFRSFVRHVTRPRRSYSVSVSR